MRHAMTTVLFPALLLGMASLGQSHAAVADEYDGNWTVLVVTEKGACDRAYRYGVRVSDGRVVYNGERSVDLSGDISPRGEVNVSIRFHGQSANGIGRLSANAGAGNWHGAGSSGACSGRWEAERR
jgi:hypothetical protein